MTDRRQVIKTIVGAALASYAGLGRNMPALATTEQQQDSVPNAAQDGRLPWRNWSGVQVCYPKTRQAPANLAEVQNLLNTTTGTVRAVGAGHSFTPLVPTDDHIVSLDRLRGLKSYDQKLHQASFGAGTRLSSIGKELDQIGQALPNMPDIDQQTLAGAISTATHGTGAQLACLSDYLVEIEMVLASGELVRASLDQNKSLFQAAQVSLGALGILTELKLQNQPKYNLERTLDWWRIEAILDQAENLASKHRNFEFFYIPFTGMGITDVQDFSDAPLSASADKDTDQNDGLYTLKRARDLLAWSPRLRRLILGTYMRTLPREHVVAPSWAVYAHSRAVRFNEMEYHLPRESGLQAFREVQAMIEKNFPEVFFPLEVRYVKADQIWLSPFYKQDSLSIAVHRYFQEDHKPLFAAVEPILRKYGGRPHWGKFHSLSQPELAELYPQWREFQTVRKELDPSGRFLNPHLRSLFGEKQA